MGCIALWIDAFAERACATVVSGRYSAWRSPTLWIPAYAGMTGRGRRGYSAWRSPTLWILDQVQYDGPGVGMTAAQPLPLWIADRVRNDVVVVPGFVFESGL